MLRRQSTARHRSHASMLVAALLLVPGRALGEPAAERDAHALRIYEASKVEYDRGHFEEAARLLVQTYALRKEPVILFNLARSYEGAGDLERALAAYVAYLEADPKASDRGAIEKRIATLRAQIDERALLEKQRNEARQRQAEEEKRRAGEREGPGPHPRSAPALVWPVAVLGTGAAMLAAGAVFGVVANGRHRDAVDEPFRGAALDLQSQASTFATLANVLFVAGGLLTGGGGAWLTVRLVSAKPDAQAPPSGAAIVLGGHF